MLRKLITGVFFVPCYRVRGVSGHGKPKILFPVGRVSGFYPVCVTSLTGSYGIVLQQSIKRTRTTLIILNDFCAMAQNNELYYKIFNAFIGEFLCKKYWHYLPCNHL
jgi:hypothetical protein